jgi:hypothetical protein
MCERISFKIKEIRMIILGQDANLIMDTASVFLYVDENRVMAESYISDLKKVIGFYDSEEMAGKALRRAVRDADFEKSNVADFQLFSNP